MIVYIAHQLGMAPSGPPGKHIKANLKAAKAWLRWAIETYPLITPIAPWITTVEVLNDKDLAHRARGFQMNQVALSRCDQIWLTGPRLSTGMREEGVWMGGWGLPVLDATYLGLTAPPPDGQTLEFIPWLPGDYAGHRMAVEEARKPKKPLALVAKGETGPANPPAAP